MADSPRLTELRRQRALIQSHLAWLEAEIAAEEKLSPATTPAAPIERVTTTASATVAPTTSPTSIARSGAANVRIETTGALAESADAHAEQIISEYRKPTNDLQHDVRTGCLLYFAAGLLLFFAAVVGLYFALRH